MHDNPFLIATAGHVDHGKTSLIRALTGVDTDRLPEEKSRAISIECGFAPAIIGPHMVSFVDVPGHERFIRQMVGGVGGMDLVMLVVGADEGVMPQTREHLGICRFTGIRGLVVALSRCDLVDVDWLELVEADIRELLADSPWPDAPIVPCSAVAPNGIDALRTTLIDTLSRFDTCYRKNRAMLPFVMPVDRVFTRPGHGTVVTGTCLQGAVRAGDTLELICDSVRDGIRIRQVERHGRAIAEGRSGSRLALNLAGLDHDDVPRGSVIAAPSGAASHVILETRLEAARELGRPIERGDAVIFQIGHFTCEGRVFAYDDAPIQAGASVPAELRLDRPAPWTPGMAFIIRGFERLNGAGLTIGGGRVVSGHTRAIPKARRAGRAAIVAAIAGEDLGEALALGLVDSGSDGMTLADATMLLASATTFAPDALGRIIADAKAIIVGDQLFGQGVIATFSRQLSAIVDNHHRAHPGENGLPRPLLAKTLRENAVRNLPDERTLDVIIGLVEGVERRGDALARTGFVAQTPELEERTYRALAALLQDAGPMPPWREDLGAALTERLGALAVPVERLIQRGLRERRFVRVSLDLVFHRDALRDLVTALDRHFQVQPTLSIADFKAISGASRKWTMPLIEWLDRERITVRKGEVRERHPSLRGNPFEETPTTAT